MTKKPLKVPPAGADTYTMPETTDPTQEVTMPATIVHGYRFLGFECYVLDDRTVVQVGAHGATRVTADRRTVLGVHADLAEALEAAGASAGPGITGRPRPAWLR